jgi:hypothetical protein
MDTFIGVDLGQLCDPTAAALIRRSMAIGPDGACVKDSRGRRLYRFDVGAIRRYPLGTPYTAIVAHVVGQLNRPEVGPRPRLVIDATGVGAAVVEMFRSALKPHPHVECYAITITAGRAATPVTRYDWHVAKVQLVGAIRSALESERLKMPPRLEHAATLRRELQDFKVKVTDAANETFSAREGAHDDLVLAVALPIWLAGLPHLEMDSDAVMLTVESAALEGEAREVAEAEAEALAMERGEWTPRWQVERDRLLRDPFWRFRKPS